MSVPSDHFLPHSTLLPASGSSLASAVVTCAPSVWFLLRACATFNAGVGHFRYRHLRSHHGALSQDGTRDIFTRIDTADTRGRDWSMVRGLVFFTSLAPLKASFARFVVA